jgi:hypothetical protein
MKRRAAARRRNLASCPLALIVAVLVAACGSVATGGIMTPRAHRLARWLEFAHAQRPLDVVSSDAGRRILAAADARLWLLGATGALAPLAQGAGGYRSPGGEEPYIALSPDGCYGTGSVYALRLVSGRGVIAISAGGQVRRFASISAPGLIDGIAFDTMGHFGHRLLVTINAGSRTTVGAIDCAGGVHIITRTAPRVEGGIAVAPATFGRFAGDLIASDEDAGRIYAITPQGTTHLVADSGLPHGGDTGVESEGSSQPAYTSTPCSPIASLPATPIPAMT